VGVVDVLWTAGWDSTFRVADLILNHNAVVRPWYVMDRNRRSAETELATQDVIRAALADLDPTATQRLLATQIIKVDEIPPIPAISADWAVLRERFTGDQYEFLARLAEDQQLTLELGIEVGGHAYNLLIANVEENDGVYRLVAHPDDPALEVFRRFRFPLFNMTKLDMENAARRDGFSQVMELTWFCHSPLRGKPCGCCNPCRQTRDEGLGRRVPPLTRWRYVQVGLMDKVSPLRQVRRRHRFRP
jgi:hypothetical protein